MRPLSPLEDGFDGAGVAAPGRRLLLEPAPPGGRERVVARAPVVLGGTPLRLHEPLAVETVKGLVESRILDGEVARAPVADHAGDAVTMARARRQGAEDEKVERPLDERQCRKGHGYPLDGVGSRIVWRPFRCQWVRRRRRPDRSSESGQRSSRVPAGSFLTSETSSRTMVSP